MNCAKFGHNKVICGFVFFCVLFILNSSFLFAQSLSPKSSGNIIIYENDYIRYEVGADGFNKSFIDKKSGKDYLDASLKSRFMSINLGNGYIGASKIEYANGYLFATFGISDICARIHVRILPEYITFELISINNQSVHEFQLVNLPLTNTKYMSYFLTSTRDDNFTGCLIPLNIETTSKGTKNTFEEAALSNIIPVDIAKISKEQERGSNSLVAWCDSRVKLEGGKVALIGCPTEKILDVIERVEIENGLPHPVINGVWARKAKENRQSYLFIDYSQDTVDEVIDYARKGGFGYVMVYDGVWSSSHGSYTINRSNFAEGEVSLKRAVEKIHAAGLKAGIHTLDRVISKSDPLIHPVPHPGLLKRQENERILERDIGTFETFIPTAISPKGLLEKSGKHRHYGRDLQIDNEIISYDDLQTTPPYGFLGCKRGAYGTHPASHVKGAKVKNLAEFIGFFEPDVESDLYDIVVRNLAGIIDNVKFDMIYTDGLGENLNFYGKEPIWYIHSLAINKLYNYTTRDILWGRSPSCEWSWHVFCRNNTTDFVTRGIIQHFNVSLSDGWLGWCQREMIPYEFGWFGFFGKEIDRDATLPREIEYAFSKTCAYNGAMSIETNLSSLKANGRTEEIFATMKNWEDLKFSNYFSRDALSRIQEKGKEFTLDKDGAGKFVARQINYKQGKYIENVNGVQNVWSFENSFNSQPLSVVIKSMPGLADYGDPGNKVLIRPGKLNIETSVQGPMGGPRNSEGTQFNFSLSSEQTKGGTQSFKVSAANNSSAPYGWGCVEIIMDQIQDVSQNRAMGTWIHGDSSGAVLHFVVEDNSRWVVRDWWVKLDFKGWKYVVISEPAKGEIYDFHYPYNIYFSIRHINYSQMARVYVFLSELAPKQSVACYFTQLEALTEKPGVIKNPGLTIGGQTIQFPVTLNSEDYLEYKGSQKFRAFDSKGYALAEKEIQGEIPVVASGLNTATFNCDITDTNEQRATVSIVTLGDPFK